MTKARVKKSNLEIKLAWSIATAVMLALCLCITTFALVYATLSVPGNIFSTATFDIELYNDEGTLEGTVIDDDDDIMFEPGATFKKKFSIVSKCSVDAYFRVYFEKLSGGLENSIEVRITDSEDNVLYDWMLISDMKKGDVPAADREIEPYEQIELYLWLRMPTTAESDVMSKTLNFDMCVDAVQTENNSDADFGDETE